MSNRTLAEFNHDFAGVIRSDPIGFAQSALEYLRSAGPETAAALRRYGVTIYEMRHHSDPVTHIWGAPNAD